MSFSPFLRCNTSPSSSTSPFSQCIACSVLRFQPSFSTASSTFHFRSYRLRFHSFSSLRNRRNGEFGCRVSGSDAEPDGNGEDEKDKHVSREGMSSAELTLRRISQLKQENVSTEVLSSDENVATNNQETMIDGQARIEGMNKHESGESVSSAESSIYNLSQLKQENASIEVLNSDANITTNNKKTDIGGLAQVEDADDLEVTSGSPLPGVKPQQLDGFIRIPKETIDILRDQVFGFDTFFVTGQEPYEAGVLFKGNLRGVPSKTYEKISKRLQDRLGDEYMAFLLNNPEDDKPVVVVVPRKTLQPKTAAVVPEWFAAGAFGLVTVFTLLLRNVPALQSNLLSISNNLDLLKDGLPGALVTAAILGVHEVGHFVVAKDCGVKLGVPYLVPSWQIGSFGAITRIVNIVTKREDLLKIAAAGPLAGYALGLLLFLVGFFVPPNDGLGIVVDASVFHESFLVGGIAKLLLGDVLKEGQAISVNPLVLWSWAGLLINAINSIPAGELDGGRISFAIWGRKASSRLTGLSIVLLGLASLFNDVAFYWVVLIFFLQRGPIAPLSEEISEPDPKHVALGILVLILCLLVCLPYPFPFTTDAMTTLLEL